jgi:hypothetical protein
MPTQSRDLGPLALELSLLLWLVMRLRHTVSGKLVNGGEPCLLNCTSCLHFLVLHSLLLLHYCVSTYAYLLFLNDARDRYML